MGDERGVVEKRLAAIRVGLSLVQNVLFFRRPYERSPQSTVVLPLSIRARSVHRDLCHYVELFESEGPASGELTHDPFSKK